MKRICVYCGSNSGKNPLFEKAAIELGNLIAQRGYELVYGGGSIGLMGITADAALSKGGKVIGVIPTFLHDLELGHKGITELLEVATMHDRKALMSSLSDAFIALPGGFGTLEEITEVISWTQLSVHKKPCAFLNIDGFFDPLIKFIEKAVIEGFIRKEHLSIVINSRSPEPLLEEIERWHSHYETHVAAFKIEPKEGFPINPGKKAKKND
ncbi:MAG: TIGR00730 family Rossman fold protein [Oligoflexales bacterium]|nr:TIGR00730 family Rossman fold protein [Oligoflexales bacterium]